jgi:hypothetical protein
VQLFETCLWAGSRSREMIFRFTVFFIRFVFRKRNLLAEKFVVIRAWSIFAMELMMF